MTDRDERDHLEFATDEVRKLAKTFRPQDVHRWNGTSWSYVALGLTMPLAPADRTTAMRIARAALAAAARDRRGVLGAVRSLFVADEDPIEYFRKAGRELPLPVATTWPDVLRRQVAVADILARLEANPTWQPTQPEVMAIWRAAGITDRN